jgi:hypothetical protein
VQPRFIVPSTAVRWQVARGHLRPHGRVFQAPLWGSLSDGRGYVAYRDNTEMFGVSLAYVRLSVFYAGKSGLHRPAIEYAGKR